MRRSIYEFSGFDMARNYRERPCARAAGRGPRMQRFDVPRASMATGALLAARHWRTSVEPPEISHGSPSTQTWPPSFSSNVPSGCIVSVQIGIVAMAHAAHD